VSFESDSNVKEAIEEPAKNAMQRTAIDDGMQIDSNAEQSHNVRLSICESLELDSKVNAEREEHKERD
jgi:hypothetical protein